MVEDYGRTEVWLLQNIEGGRVKISGIDGDFQQALHKLQIEEVVLIPEVVDVVEEMRLRISFRGFTTMELLNNGLNSSVVEAKNHWRKIERGRGLEESLSMIVTYSQVENALGLHLRYSEFL